MDGFLDLKFHSIMQSEGLRVFAFLNSPEMIQHETVELVSKADGA
jgi:hypothetical protein